jgi:hypothetical protein
MKLSGDVSLALEDCAIAVFGDSEKLAAATAELDGTGHEYYVLEGEEGRDSLHPEQEGMPAMIQRLIAAFGDELRIIDRLDRSLADGDQVLIVKAVDDQPSVVAMLTRHGGRFLWQFRGWTFNSAGTADDNTPVAEEDGS